jgi:hypothetical protein
MDRYSFAVGDSHPLALTDFADIYHNHYYITKPISYGILWSDSPPGATNDDYESRVLRGALRPQRARSDLRSFD